MSASRLGLIGGLGPGATVQYYRELVKLNAGELVIIHADMDRVLSAVEQNDRAGLAAYFARLIERLARSGAEIAAISAITPHICIRELEQISPLPLVNIIEEVRKEILSRGLKTVALLGTRFVVESRMFGMLGDIHVVVPEQVDAIHEAYLQIVNGDSPGRAVLIEIARKLPVDAVVLAGTDLSLVFHEDDTDFPHVDCVRAHLNGIMRAIR